jgi:hypothetical protein
MKRIDIYMNDSTIDMEFQIDWRVIVAPWVILALM